MKKELRERIISYNKSVAENTEKASDLEIIVSAIKKLPRGQLKKFLSEDVIAVFKKYGVDFTEQGCVE